LFGFILLIDFIKFLKSPKTGTKNQPEEEQFKFLLPHPKPAPTSDLPAGSDGSACRTSLRRVPEHYHPDVCGRALDG